MTDKEKITEILKAYTKKHNISASSVILEEYAEELIANGVIVPPCKVGDTVYKISTFNEMVELKVKEFVGEVITEPYNIISFDKFGKNVFLPKEEKLKELGK